MQTGLQIDWSCGSPVLATCGDGGLLFLGMATGLTTRERIVREAACLLRAQGVSRTGVLDVLRAAQAPRGSLYHHFPGGKAQLVVEGLRHGADEVTHRLRDLARSDAPAGRLVVALADGLADELEASGYRNGCPVATAALERAAEDDAVARIAADAYDTWERLLRERLEAEALADAAGLAEEVLVAVEGALVLAHARRDAEVLRRTGRRWAQRLTGH